MLATIMICVSTHKRWEELFCCCWRCWATQGCASPALIGSDSVRRGVGWRSATISRRIYSESHLFGAYITENVIIIILRDPRAKDIDNLANNTLS